MSKLGLYLIVLISLIGCVTTEAHVSDIYRTVVKIELTLYSEPVGYGSGVLIACNKKSTQISGEYYELLFVTAKHVMNQLRWDMNLAGFAVFNDDTKVLIESVTLHSRIDCALFTAKSEKYVKPCVLDPEQPVPLEGVYAAGVPMGWAFVVSTGIINYSVANKVPYSWICTAPLFFGNSGGGVFSSKTNRLVGISIMIGGSDDMPPGVVTHIHVFVPINYVYDWISEVKNERSS
jgi:S1-C subfamily serine protease